MKTVELNVARREKLGKGHAKRLRKANRIPAVLYGPKLSPVSLDVDLKEFRGVIKTGARENVILNLKIEGDKGKGQTAIIKELQLDPVTDNICHVDFNAISLTEKLRVKIPLQAKGDAPGVKEGGVLDFVHREIEVECLPTEIPERIFVDVSNLNITDSIHVKDLSFPSEVVCVLLPDEVVVTVLAPMKEEVVMPAEGAAAAEPEVIGKKKEEEAGEKAEEGGASGKPAEKAAPAKGAEKPAKG